MRTLTLIALLAFGGVAEAHTLSMTGAQRVAERHVERVGSQVRPPARSTSVGLCERRTRHRVDCVARFRFDGVICTQVIRVRMARHATPLLVGGPDCR